MFHWEAEIRQRLSLNHPDDTLQEGNVALEITVMPRDCDRGSGGEMPPVLWRAGQGRSYFKLNRGSRRWCCAHPVCVCWGQSVCLGMGKEVPKAPQSQRFSHVFCKVQPVHKSRGKPSTSQQESPAPTAA